jgi:hypothetical protein
MRHYNFGRFEFQEIPAPNSLAFAIIWINSMDVAKKENVELFGGFNQTDKLVLALSIFITVPPTRDLKCSC